MNKNKANLDKIYSYYYDDSNYYDKAKLYQDLLIGDLECFLPLNIQDNHIYTKKYTINNLVDTDDKSLILYSTLNNGLIYNSSKDLNKILQRMKLFFYPIWK